MVRHVNNIEFIYQIMVTVIAEMGIEGMLTGTVFGHWVHGTEQFCNIAT